MTEGAALHGGGPQVATGRCMCKPSGPRMVAHQSSASVGEAGLIIAQAVLAKETKTDTDQRAGRDGRAEWPTRGPM